MLRRTGLIALLMVVSLPVNAETDDIKEWHKQIHTQLMSNSRFPRAARGQTGTAKVGFVLDRQGKPVSHWLAESTGNRVLDEESHRSRMLHIGLIWVRKLGSGGNGLAPQAHPLGGEQ